MTLTERDKKIGLAIIPIVIVLAYWMLLLAPKRQEASASGEALATEQQKLADVESRSNTLDAAKTNFARDYAAVLRLGKAIPASVDMPSLLVQLEQAAKGTGITFQSVVVGDRVAPETSTAAAVPPAGGGAPAPEGTAPSGQPPVSGPGQAAASANGATGAANAASASAQQAANADPGAAQAPGSVPAGGPPTSGALEKVPLDFSFKGSFFELADLFHKLKRFVYVAGDQVRVRGRLMTIDSVDLRGGSGHLPDPDRDRQGNRLTSAPRPRA